MTPPRDAFVLAATVDLAPGADTAAPGAAVTVELCGHWEHEGTCRYPHHTAATPAPGGALALRVIYAVPPAEEPHVRARILDALRTGTLDRPGGPVTWTLRDAAPDEVAPAERPLAGRLAASS